MEFRRHTTLRKQGLNLTSLIDIIFLLVVFFMLTTSFSKLQLVPMSLSTITADSEIPAGSEAILIQFSPNQSFFLEGRYYKLARLKTVLNDLMERNNIKSLTPIPIILVGERGVNIQDMMATIKIIEGMGGRNVSLVGYKDDTH